MFNSPNKNKPLLREVILNENGVQIIKTEKGEIKFNHILFLFY